LNAAAAQFRLVADQSEMDMADQVGAYEAKTHLPALLERVARGEQITITKHGKPVARLVPIRRTDPDRRAEAIEKLKKFSKGRTLGVPVKQLINEGRA
jgi:prevent-host-death family protein